MVLLLLSLRTPLVDNWYSISYLYFSALGTLITLFVGMLISLPTGNYKHYYCCIYLYEV